VVNFAHGALFMLGAFCAVTLSRILSLSYTTIDETQKDFLGNPLKVKTPYVESWFGPEIGSSIIDWAVPLAIIFAIPVMVAVGFIMERGLIKHFYKRPHADQILVTFGLAIVLQEVVKYYFGANPIQTGAPEVFKGSFDFGVLIGFDPNAIIYPYWRLVYFAFAAVIIGAVFAFLQFTTFGMVVRAGMADRETVGLLGINIDKRFTIMFGIAAAVAGLAGVMYAPINSPNYHMGMDFLVLSFVVVVVGGMGSLPGAVLAGFLLGILESFASFSPIKVFFETWLFLPSIDQIIIYLVAIIILLTRPRGLLGRKGVMED
jgi:branched-chain amino acid transport system permease protein